MTARTRLAFALLLLLACDQAVEPEVLEPASVTITPSAATLLAVGDTVNLTVEVRDQYGEFLPTSSAVWTSDAPGTATVDAQGVVTAMGNGTATITALAEGLGAASVVTVANSDRAALAALYEATDGPNWVDNTNWLTDAPLGEWYGVDTDASGRVVRLDLSGKWYSEAQELVRHGLTGEIPPELGNLANLRSLWLYENQLTGEIPPELGNLANLRSLWLYENQLTGEIPPELGNLANLAELLLFSNQLTGEISPELGNLTNLFSLGLAFNALTGPIPPELGNLANLRSLELSRNALTGPIPPELGNLANLRSLWLQRNQLTGPIPPELGNLVNLDGLSLYGNVLTGPIPPELGNLANLRSLWLERNALTGPIPQGFLELRQLETLRIARTGICLPGTSSFALWIKQIENYRGSLLCNAGDVAALGALYEAGGGTEWTDSDGWLSDRAVEEWHGVTADSLGRVTGIDLAGNGLAGKLTPALGGLTRVTVLRIGDNQLSGRLPLGLTGLPLVEFHYRGTQLCAPADVSFQRWVSGISSYDGTGEECARLSDREILEILHAATNGPNWSNNDGWLTDASLAEWYGVSVDHVGRVVGLNLGGNALTGPIPPELGNLVNLDWLSLSGNALTGSIPPELGNLVNLERLWFDANDLTGPIPPELGNLANLFSLGLDWNDLTGPIPPELGNLVNLEWLLFHANDLTGPIPPELGNLANLTELSLGRNALTGPIPPELGNLANLTELSLGRNALTGPIPPELGNLANLTELSFDRNALTGSIPPELGGMTRLMEAHFSNNSALAGPLPAEMTSLRGLEVLLASGTDLCVPMEGGFRTWLAGMHKRWIPMCGDASLSAAYLTQVVQSWEFPVPLVAGRDALLRVFPTAIQATSEGVPAVRARFYVDGRETHVEEIPGGTVPIPIQVDEGDLLKSANAEIAGHVIQPGLEMVLEVDPGGTLDAALGVAKRIPATGRLAVEVESMPVFDLTLIPFVWTETHDSSIVELVNAMAADPENHEMLGDTRELLPIGELSVTAHDPVLSSSNNVYALIGETDAIRVMEGGTGHYKGMMSRPVTGAGGVAHLSGRSSFSPPSPSTLAHELGHNFSLSHAPCGDPDDLDPSYPHDGGAIGAWGYDFDEARLVPPARPDVMSYCGTGMDQRLSFHERTSLPPVRRGDAGRDGVRCPEQVAASVGRCERGRRALP